MRKAYYPIFEPVNEPDKKAEIYMDKLFPSYEGKFMLEAIIKKSSLSDEEKLEALRLEENITDLLIDVFGYAKDVTTTYQIYLTEKGRLAKQKGGHFKFLEDANSLPTQPHTTPTTNKTQKGYWLVNILSNNWTVTIIGSIIAAIITALIIWYFKIPH